MASSAASAEPQPHRIALNEHHSYELTVVIPSGATLHLFEQAHDAAVFLTRLDIVQLRADLASLLLVLGPVDAPQPGIHSVEAKLIVEHVRQVFMALVELDKVRPGEVDAVAAVIVQHLRSWRPFALREGVPL